MRKTARILGALTLGSGLALTPLTAHAQEGRVRDRFGDSSFDDQSAYTGFLKRS